MIELRKRDTLGGGNFGWLETKHHFSFGDYHDPARMGWGALRVWNDDSIAAGTGFPLHPHADMEIVTYVTQGAISHKDSLGNTGRTAAGDVQVMSAGSGIRHAEFNAEPGITRLFQIWILPRGYGDAPSWGTSSFPKGDRAGSFIALASGFAEDTGALPIRADGRVMGASLKAGQILKHRIKTGCRAYLVPAMGWLEIDGLTAGPGDGLAIADETDLAITAKGETELVLVEVM